MLDHFAEELRLARAVSGMSQTALAEALSYSGALVAKVETCERRPSLDFARRCDTVFGADGRFERIQKRISRETVVPWFRDWAGIEQEATALRSFEPLYVPGLLQTEAYARAIHAGGGLFARRTRSSSRWRPGWTARACSLATGRRCSAWSSTSTCCAAGSADRR
ncbi:Scr1 family TA system antitoxin-like transcriptional regulator [Micromonospora sp. WMMD558]|uniref:helix-turn-helix domain-containing protein n=1 Tax=Micromonospora sp. WMMD558 TaxID=3403462 RepID=UPI003BF5C190